MNYTPARHDGRRQAVSAGMEVTDMYRVLLMNDFWAQH